MQATSGPMLATAWGTDPLKTALSAAAAPAARSAGRDDAPKDRSVASPQSFSVFRASRAPPPSWQSNRFVLKMKSG